MQGTLEWIKLSQSGAIYVYQVREENMASVV